MRSMSVSRLVTVVAVLLTACAGWDSSSPSAPPPPAESPVPSSHYAPPPPANPDPTPALPDAQHVEMKVAIASVQLLEDCPDPEPAAAAAAGSAAPAREMAVGTERSSQRGKRAPGSEGDSFRRSCAQSMVQLSLRSDVPGGFRIEAARVIDPKTQKSAGTAKLRAPTRWDEAGGTYAAWNERVDSKAELKISYKLGELDLARAVELVGPEFNTYGGPFVLELDVSIDGHRQTIRSPEFTREPPHIMVT